MTFRHDGVLGDEQHLEESQSPFGKTATVTTSTGPDHGLDAADFESAAEHAAHCKSMVEAEQKYERASRAVTATFEAEHLKDFNAINAGGDLVTGMSSGPSTTSGVTLDA